MSSLKNERARFCLDDVASLLQTIQIRLWDSDENIRRKYMIVQKLCLLSSFREGKVHWYKTDYFQTVTILRMNFVLRFNAKHIIIIYYSLT